ncbi:MAG: hypothetical protein ACOCRX_09935 [Candidatus Woesearchaeota archaeon]
MSKKKYSYTQLGMLFGIFISGGISVILFATTMNALYFTIIGLGTAFGLLTGALIDRHKKTEDK